MVDVQEWEAEAVRLKAEGKESAEIAEIIGKHPATVRKAIKRAREAEESFDSRAHAMIEGQTTVDDFTATCEHGEPADVECLTCRDDALRDLHRPPDEPRDPLEDFKAEAGEAVGPMPPATPEEPGETSVTLPLMKGTRQLALDFGPNAAPAHEATVKFASEKWPSGHFGLGDVVTGTFTARIVSIPAKEAFDKDSEEFRAKPIAYGALITELDYEAVDPDE